MITETGDIRIKMVCKCGNEIYSAYEHSTSIPDSPGTYGVAKIFTGMEYICLDCGGTMTRKITKHTKTETETEIKPGENL